MDSMCHPTGFLHTAFACTSVPTLLKSIITYLNLYLYNKMVTLLKTNKALYFDIFLWSILYCSPLCVTGFLNFVLSLDLHAYRFVPVYNGYIYNHGPDMSIHINFHAAATVSLICIGRHFL